MSEENGPLLHEEVSAEFSPEELQQDEYAEMLLDTSVLIMNGLLAQQHCGEPCVNVGREESVQQLVCNSMRIAESLIEAVKAKAASMYEETESTDA